MFMEETSFTFTDFDIPGATSTSQLWGINNRGDVVGSFFDGIPNEHGFILDHKGHLIVVDVPDANLTEANDINNKGEIVGSYLVEEDGQSSPHRFISDRRGNITTLEVPGALNTILYGINDRGQIVGQSFSFGVGDPLLSGGFLFDDDEFTSIAVQEPSDFVTVPHDINNRGEIVGSFGNHAFIYERGEFTLFDYPGAVFGTRACGINNHGQIVGQAAIDRGVVDGFLYDDGQFTTVNYPMPLGPTNTVLRDINDHGEIVGNSVSARTAFLVT